VIIEEKGFDQNRAYSPKGSGLFVFMNDDLRFAPYDNEFTLRLPAEAASHRHGHDLTGVKHASNCIS
jgi:hypothetical protein